MNGINEFTSLWFICFVPSLSCACSLPPLQDTLCQGQARACLQQTQQQIKRIRTTKSYSRCSPLVSKHTTTAAQPRATLELAFKKSPHTPSRDNKAQGSRRNSVHHLVNRWTQARAAIKYGIIMASPPCHTPRGSGKTRLFCIVSYRRKRHILKLLFCLHHACVSPHHT